LVKATIANVKRTPVKKGVINAINFIMVWFGGKVIPFNILPLLTL
jgi:hypothetical protein